MGLQEATSEAVGNILRVMRGSGKPWRVADDLIFLGNAIKDEVAENGRGAVEECIVSALRSWKTPFIDRYDWLLLIREEISKKDGTLDKVTADIGLTMGVLRLLASGMAPAVSERQKAERDICVSISQIEDARLKYDEFHFPKPEPVAANDNVERESFVYFISDGAGAIKIGKAINPKARMSSLQTSLSDRRLVLLATIPGDETLEKRLHKKFDAHRKLGEWFDDCEPIREHIAKHAQADDERWWDDACGIAVANAA